MRRQIEHRVYKKLSLEETIGKGSYGNIYKAKGLANGEILAVKVIPAYSDPDTLTKIEKQIEILSSTSHKNIVKCHSVEIVDECVWIIMDYCELGSLADIMSKNKKAFSQNQIRHILHDIIEALVYLHESSIIHRDIKAANILVNSEGEIKVADFGVSTIINHTQIGRNTRTGSPFWMSPELLSKSIYNFKTDIWSLGITAIELAEGAPPYSHQHPYRAIFSIQSHPPNSLTHSQDWSPQFNDFVKQCLTFDQSHRPTAKQLLSHPFFSQQTQNLSQSESYNTVLLHSSKVEDSIWQKDYQNGTMVIKDGQYTNLSPTLINKFQKMEEENEEKNNQNMVSIEQLYQEMEDQISKVRSKYFKKISQFQEKTSQTFSFCLKNQKMLKKK